MNPTRGLFISRQRRVVARYSRWSARQLLRIAKTPSKTEDRMTIRSYLASFSWLALVANPANAWADQPNAYTAPVYPYHEGWALPPGYHIESRPHKGLLWTGVGIFSGFYGTTLLGLGGKDQDPARSYLLIPIAGPLFFASNRECPSPCDDFATGPLMFMLAAGQATGAALFGAAFLAPKRWVVPDAASPRFALVPRMDRTNAGVIVLGDF
jgi:hypothetical protein